MARSDLIIALVRAGASGDRLAARRASEAIIAEERAKQHTVLAGRLEDALSTADQNGTIVNQRNPLPASETARLFVERVPRRSIVDMTLPGSVRVTVNQVIEEQARSGLLRSFGLDPRHKILLTGPPGNGKTTLAESIAYDLSVPLLVIKYDAVIGSFLGETAANLGRVFDYVRSRPCVLLLDEFDAIGKERGDTHETGEIKRVVSSLLLQMDDLPSWVVVVAASNHPELLDRAAWRRFQVIVELPRPTPDQTASLIEQWLHGLRGVDQLNAMTVAKRLGPVSFGEVESFCLDVKRRMVLTLDEQPVKGIVGELLRLRLDSNRRVRESGGRESQKAIADPCVSD